MGLSRKLCDVTAATRRNGSSLTAKASERSKNVIIFGHFVARLGEIGPPVILGNRRLRSRTTSTDAELEALMDEGNADLVLLSPDAVRQPASAPPALLL